jgi:hypothetical protein
LWTLGRYVFLELFWTSAQRQEGSIHQKEEILQDEDNNNSPNFSTAISFFHYLLLKSYDKRIIGLHL